MLRSDIIALSGMTIKMGTLSALIVLAVATAASSVGPVPCPPKDEKLYTPNKSQIETQLKKLENFEVEMRAVLLDVETLQTEDTVNRRLGKFEGYRQITSEATKVICAGVNLADPKLGRICKAGEYVSDAVNDVISCSQGEALGCVGLGLKGTRVDLKSQRKRIDDQTDDVIQMKTTRPKPKGPLSQKEKQMRARQMEEWNEEIRDLQGAAKENEGRRRMVELLEKSKKGGESLEKGKNVHASNDMEHVKQDAIGLGKGVCDLTAKSVGGKVASRGEDVCVIGSSIAAGVAAYEDIGKLEDASKQNQARLGKLTLQLEAKVNTVSQRISQLRREFDGVDWSAMGKLEPNMTPIKQGECEDSKEKEDVLNRLANEGLGELDRVRQVAPAREPAQGQADTNGLAILGQVLGDAAAFQREFDQQRQLYKGPAGAPVSEYYRLDKGPNHQLDSQGSTGLEQQHQAGCREVVKKSQNGISTVQIVCGGDTGSGSSTGRGSAFPKIDNSGKAGGKSPSHVGEGRTTCYYENGYRICPGVR